MYSDVYQTDSTVEYDGSNTVSIVMDEQAGASGIKSIQLYYQINNNSWTLINATITRNFTFTHDMLSYGQQYNWYFLINDTAGNINTTSVFSFTVTDSYSPRYSNLTQTDEMIEYDAINNISIAITEPDDASGLDIVLLYYRVDNGSWLSEIIANHKNYIFTSEILRYGEIYDWYLWFNDTAGNYNQTMIQNFSVVDTTYPSFTNLSITNSEPGYNESVVISINVYEPLDACGVESIFIYYSIEDELFIEDITLTQNYTFAANLLRYGQIYSWFILFNDSEGNYNQTSLNMYQVVDTTAPNLSSKTHGIPEYDNDYEISGTVIEPEDASGVDSVLLYYTLDFIKWTIEDVTLDLSYIFSGNELAFNQTYYWYFWFNDTAGNFDFTAIQNFTVVDFTSPHCLFVDQNTPTPEYDESNTVSALVFEPEDASGVDSVYIFYRVDNQSWQHNLLNETQNFVFNDSMLVFGQFWEWFFWYNDTVGNSAQTPIVNFTVQDFTPPIYSNIAQTKQALYEGENNTVSLYTTEPADASGVLKIEIRYSQDRKGWDIYNVTMSLQHIFFADELDNGTYYWFFRIYDEAGNYVDTPENTFTVNVSIIDLTPIIPLGILSSLILGSAAIILFAKRKK
jgi:hypothetical protein